jgi:hypothetical protein
MGLVLFEFMGAAEVIVIASSRRGLLIAMDVRYTDEVAEDVALLCGMFDRIREVQIPDQTQPTKARHNVQTSSLGDSAISVLSNTDIGADSAHSARSSLLRS